MDIICGDILLFKSRSLINSLTKKETSPKYCHAAVAIDKFHVAEATIKGVFINHISHDLKDYDIYRIDGLASDTIDRLILFIQEKISLKHDYRKFFRFLIEKYVMVHIPDNENKYICSEFVYDAFLSAGLDLLPNNNLDIVTPKDLSSSESLHKIESLLVPSYR